MLKDIIEESWAYKEMYEEAQIKTLRKVILRYIHARFPQQEALATPLVNSMEDAQKLEKLTEGLYEANTDAEVTQLLLSQQA